MHPLARDLQEWPKCIASLLLESDCLTKRSSSQQGKIAIGGGTTFVPVVEHVVCSIEAKVSPATGRLVSVKSARPCRPVFPLNEIPQSYKSRHTCDSLRTPHVLTLRIISRRSNAEGQQSHRKTLNLYGQ